MASAALDAATQPNSGATARLASTPRRLSPDRRRATTRWNGAELSAANGRSESLRFAKRHANLLYLGGIALLTMAAVCVVGLAASLMLGRIATGGYAALLLLAVMPASDLAVGVVNFLVTSTIRPQILPKLDFSKGIPTDHHTLVVMPTMLTSETSSGRCSNDWRFSTWRIRRPG